MSRSLLALCVALWISLISAQYVGRVGPTTPLANKRAKKTCDITRYGARPGKGGDIGPALRQAFADCKSGGNIVIPAGEWGLGTWVDFNGGSGWALQWDGTIHRTGKAGGNMLMVKGANDVEFWSSNGQGAFQGNGYEFHLQGNIKGPRILRFVKVTNFAVHDLAFADSPSFHFSMDTCKNGEVYNMAIRGAYQGGLDGIDVWADNMWIHDIMVTNKDECVDIKNPAHNILVENIYCNWSGGSAFGSLNNDVDISNIVYRNVYTVHSNQQIMFKSYGGTGRVYNVLLENFIGFSNAYTFNIDQKWGSMKPNGGPGVKLSNITARNWSGTCEDGERRGPIKVICADQNPCKDIRLSNFNVGTDKGNSVSYTCQSAYGSGGCLQPGAGGAYAMVKQSVASRPSGRNATRMPWDLRENPGVKKPIAIPKIPDYFFPGTRPIKPLARARAARLVRRQNPADPPLAPRNGTATATATATAKASGKPRDEKDEPRFKVGGRKNGTGPPPP